MKVVNNHPDQEKIAEYRGKIAGYRSGLNFVNNYYSKEETKQRIFSFGREAFNNMKNQAPERLQWYLDYFGLKSENEYIDFLENQLDIATSSLLSNAILGKRYHFKKLVRPNYYIPFLANFNGFCTSGKESYIYIDLKSKKVLPSQIERRTVHEAEHFFQNTLIGNLGKESKGDESSIANTSPIYWQLFQNIGKVFKNINLIVDDDTLNDSSVRTILYTLKYMFQGIIDDQVKYYGNILEILARIRQIKWELGITDDKKFTEDDISILEGIKNLQREVLKDNISDKKAFIDLVNSTF